MTNGLDQQPCPLCGTKELFAFAERRGVPVQQNFLFQSAAAAREAVRGDLSLACCRSCGFVTNTAFSNGVIHYGPDYENDQTYSPAFESYVDGLVDSLVDAGCRHQFVLEVGSGQGRFLRRLCAKGANRGLGFDPAYRGQELATSPLDSGGPNDRSEALAGASVRFAQELYHGQKTPEAPYLVLCLHVLEHVPDPMRLLRDIGNARATHVVFELRALDWILEHVTVQDFFYEHCSYFTVQSLRFAFERAGFANVQLTPTYGGQYVWATAEPRRPHHGPAPVARPTATVAAVMRYGSQEPAVIEAVREQTRSLEASAGPIAVWGAGAKGVTFLNLVDPDGRLVDCTVDLNQKKQGKYVAGTGHRIVSPGELPGRGVRAALVMNPNHLDEVRAIVRATCPDVRVVALTSHVDETHAHDARKRGAAHAGDL